MINTVNILLETCHKCTNCVERNLKKIYRAQNRVKISVAREEKYKAGNADYSVIFMSNRDE